MASLDSHSLLILILKELLEPPGVTLYAWGAGPAQECLDWGDSGAASALSGLRNPVHPPLCFQNGSHA